MNLLLSTLIYFISLHQGIHTNFLIYENSPYLQQHAHDIVNWRAWNEATLKEALKQKKPIFLSIGFSTCHWCHVMRRQVFNNPEIAKLINKYFIPIKIDREEFPNIDAYYMKLYEIMEERKGGWPLTFILTENLEPIFAGTFVSPYSTEKFEGLDKIIPEVLNEYKNDRKFISEEAKEYKSLIKNDKFKPVNKVDFPLQTIKSKILEDYDNKNAGFNYLKIKFPEADLLDLLLNIYKFNQDEHVLKISLNTLDSMMKSGLYDQIEGAFFRYSTDYEYKIPHFEKMLYTNALLIKLYSKAYQITKNIAYKMIVIDTIKEINRIYLTENNLYYSASDAESYIDNKKQEGGYFIYSYNQTKNVLINNGFSENKANKFLKSLDITQKGNFEKAYSVVNLKNIKIDNETFMKGIEILRKIRRKRQFPFIDKKILTSWNALMVTALLNAGYIDSKYQEQGLNTLSAILNKLGTGSGLKHIYINNNTAEQKGLLEDYSYLIEALINAYQVTLDKKYINKAYDLSKIAMDKFFENGVWYLSENKFIHSDLLDRYMTSPVSVIIDNLMIISLIKEDKKMFKIAEDSIKSVYTKVIDKPLLYPKSISNIFEYKLHPILLKSSKSNLLKLEGKIFYLKRPYIYLKAIEIDNYIGCSLNICFAVGKSLDDIKEKLIEFK